jgi:mannose-6-phosphate isomerase-like protein (cupin superfamily)
MNKVKVVSELTKQYPGKKVICIPEDEPSEILCEVEPSMDHSDYSEVMAVIDESAPHVHKVTTEEYEIVKGSLTLYLDEKPHLLNQGDRMVIKPLEKHWAKGKASVAKVTSHPGWTPEDHVLIG